jgi:hypothetical protein
MQHFSSPAGAFYFGAIGRIGASWKRDGDMRIA